MAYPHQLTLLETGFPPLRPGQLTRDSSDYSSSDEDETEGIRTHVLIASEPSTPSPPLSPYLAAKGQFGSVTDSLASSEAHSEPKEEIAKSRLEETRQRVEKLTDRVRESVQNIMERGEKIDDLHERAYNLFHESYQFKKVTRSLRSKLWGQNKRLFIGILIGIAVFIVVLIFMFMPPEKRPF